MSWYNMWVGNPTTHKQTLKNSYRHWDVVGVIPSDDVNFLRVHSKVVQLLLNARNRHIVELLLTLFMLVVHSHSFTQFAEEGRK